MKSVLLVEETK